ALYWASVRSTKEAAKACFGPGYTGLPDQRDWANGCTTAKNILDATDYCRTHEPDYKDGWKAIKAQALNRLRKKSRVGLFGTICRTYFGTETIYLVRLRCAADFFRSLLSCSLSRFGTQNICFRGSGTGRLRGAHSRRQDPKTPVEQALI